MHRYFYIYIYIHIYILALCMVGLQTEQLEPNPFCSPRGFSPRYQPRPTVGHIWGPQGTRWPSSRISAQPSITVRAQGSRLPQGMNYGAINHARLSRRVLCPPSIRRHKQLCSQQDWRRARQKWVQRDPGDLWGGSQPGWEIWAPWHPLAPAPPQCKALWGGGCGSNSLFTHPASLSTWEGTRQR